MGVFNFRPARTQVDNAKVICDLDALTPAEPAAIRFGGKAYRLKPVTLGTLFGFTNAIGRMETLKKGSLTEEEAVREYVVLYSTVLEGFGEKEVREMPSAFHAVLLKNILDYVTGVPVTAEDTQKKKT